MRLNTHLICTLCLLLLCACKNGNAAGTSKNESTPQDTIKAIVMPDIPPMLTEPELRADFLAKHYWDNANLADTNYIHHPEVTEQAWVDYCDILNIVPLETAQQAMRKLMEKAGADKKVFNYFADLADKYLYNPNAPMRNEEYYIPVLEAMIASPLLSEAEKIRPQDRLMMAQKNRIGTPATDFTYTLASGAQGTLYKVKADYTVVFINNPGCHACTEYINALKGAPIINQLLAEKKLILLGIYPDEEIDEWRTHRGEFPTEWINAYDKTFAIKDQRLYDLKATPTLYLLDKNKKVLLKDATVPAVEQYFTRLLQ